MGKTNMNSLIGNILSIIGQGLVIKLLMLILAFNTLSLLQYFVCLSKRSLHGSKVVLGNRTYSYTDHIATHTSCPKDIVLSTLIDSYDTFKTAILAVIGCWQGLLFYQSINQFTVFCY